ncbi:MAG: ATP-dependent Clp protease proteolytic subunit [Aquimonas sp.]|nr:ATP-dependent Clp protease proteolytic subunit [Aquimonas sp.]
MTLLSLLALFVLLVLLQPFVHRLWLARKREQLRHRIEAERGSRLILLVHREERMSMLGVPLLRYIDMDDAESVVRAVHQTPPEQPIDLVLHTPGGLVLASLQIARALARHPGPVRALVPHYAMSGGTLLAIAADEIIMSPHAVLGPLDPAIEGVPAASILRAVAQKDAKDVDDGTLILADQAQMAIRQLRESLVDLLVERLGKERAEEVAVALTEGRWTHDYPIMPEQIAELGFKVDIEMPERVLELMSLYPQPLRGLGGVEYARRPRDDEPPQQEA